VLASHRGSAGLGATVTVTVTVTVIPARSSRAWVAAAAPPGGRSRWAQSWVCGLGGEEEAGEREDQEEDQEDDRNQEEGSAGRGAAAFLINSPAWEPWAGEAESGAPCPTAGIGVWSSGHHG
jgi:hypothetical protein